MNRPPRNGRALTACVAAIAALAAALLLLDACDPPLPSAARWAQLPLLLR